MRHLNTPSLGLARQTLRDLMCRAGWPASSISDAELALVELLVNAWRHAGTAAPLVCILAVPATLRVSVADDSPLLPERQAISELAESGRGLQLVEGLTHRWGVEPRELGKNIWFELDSAA